MMLMVPLAWMVAMSTMAISGQHVIPYRQRSSTERRALLPRRGPASSRIRQPSMYPATVPEAPAALEECPTRLCVCEMNLKVQKPVITCKRRSLQTVPVFNVTDTIYYELDLTYNNINDLQNDSFHNARVQRINLLRNELDTIIQPLAFRGLEPYLEELSIEGNGIIPIPYDRMTNLTKLRRLVIKNFRQDSPRENGYFQHLPNLETLIIEDVTKLQIDDNTFRDKLHKLQTLAIKNVEISQIPVQSLQQLSSIRTLQIMLNRLLVAVVGGSFENLHNLKILNLAYNSIMNIDGEAFNGIAQSLEELNLGNNKLKPAALASLSSQKWTNLEYLTLSYNTELNQMPGNVFKNMPNLQLLYLQDVNLKVLSPGMFLGLNNLVGIDLSYNRIEMIEARTFAHTKLNEIFLDAQSAIITIAPGAFSGLENSLQGIHLTENNIQQDAFWSMIATLRELQMLILRKTDIQSIPNYAFRQNNKLWQLDLGNNGITSLNSTQVSGLENSLIELSLEKNSLTTISECVFRNFTRLNELNLHLNPLACDCRLIWLHRFLHTTDSELFVKDNYKCKSPAEFENRLMYEIPEATLCSEVIAGKCANVPLTTPTGPSPSTTQTTPSTPSSSYSFKMSIPSTTQYSMIVVWSVDVKTSVTGYKLEYTDTVDPNSKRETFLHRDEITLELRKLRPGKFYMVCMTVEVNQVWDKSSRTCKTTQTLDDGSQPPINGEEADSNTRYYVIGGIIAGVFVLVLLAAGVYTVAKYRYKAAALRDMPFTFTPTVRHGENGEMVCSIPNEYMEINNVRTGEKYYVPSPRMVRHQMAVDGTENPYNTYQRSRGRRNPYENDDDEWHWVDEGSNANKANSEEVLIKSDLSERHSAPSRLDANDLLKTDSERNSRPLPATPKSSQEMLDQNNKAQQRSHTAKTQRGKKRSDQRDTAAKTRHKEFINNSETLPTTHRQEH